MAMSRKHFEAVAATIACQARRCETPGETAAVANIARDLAFVFKSDNPRFDKARFLTACGIES